MSNFTTQVRFICETANKQSESSGLSGLDEIIEAGRQYIFDFNYPIFDAAYKSVLETKIIKHFYTREIGEETVGLWKLRLNARMNEIMPYYNQLYKSELLSFNPLYDVDYTRAGGKSGTQKRSAENTETGNETETRTGTTGITGQSNETASTTNRQDTTGVTNKSESGTVDSRENTSSYQNGTIKNSGSDTRAVQSDGTEHTTNNGTTSHSGTDTETTAADRVMDHWDYYSDTPQGGLSGISNLDYLTNVRHTTDDSTGSEEVKTINHGERITDNSTTTKSTSNTGTDTLTRNTNENTETIGEEDKKRGETSSHKAQGTDTETTEGMSSTTKQGTDTRTQVDDSKTTRNALKSGQTSETARNIEDYTERVAGKMGTVSYSKLLKEFRETFLNIDMLIIDNLGDLFFGLWE